MALRTASQAREV